MPEGRGEEKCIAQFKKIMPTHCFGCYLTDTTENHFELEIQTTRKKLTRETSNKAP